MDFMTVNARSFNGWKYNGLCNFATYTFHSVGVISHVMADWVPPAGSRSTGPRDWMDNAMQIMHLFSSSPLLALG